jgi:Na+/H+-dicarboxylate symporter
MKESKKQSMWSAYRFPIILLSSIILGSIIGLVMGNKATIFQPLGDIFINAMFTIVVPLVFVVISSAVASMSNLKRLGKILGYIVLVFVITGAIASIIMLFTVKVFPPAQGFNLQLQAGEAIQPLKTADQIVKALTVTDFPDLLSRKNMLPLFFFSVLFGLGVAMLGEKGTKISDALDSLSKVILKIVSLIMYYAPIGLGAYFASLVGSLGPQLLGAYARAMAEYYPVCILYFFVAFAAYAYYAGGKEGISKFFKFIIPPAITSLATCSSNATIPVELTAAENIGVPKDIRNIVIPIGATAHMDGSCLSAILKIAFLFGVYKMPFSGLGVYITAVGIAVLSSVAMSGVPGGGLIGEMLIVSMYKFPPTAFPLIATIGFLVDPPATMVNSTGDTVASMIIARLIEGKDWMKKNLRFGEDAKVAEQ